MCWLYTPPPPTSVGVTADHPTKRDQNRQVDIGQDQHALPPHDHEERGAYPPPHASCSGPCGQALAGNVACVTFLQEWWHGGDPRITPYIFTAKGKHKRKGIKMTHLAHSLLEACDLLFHAASQGKNILMIPSQKEQLSSVSCNKGIEKAHQWDEENRENEMELQNNSEVS